jgi:hypothetical protein
VCNGAVRVLGEDGVENPKARWIWLEAKIVSANANDVRLVRRRRRLLLHSIVEMEDGIAST